MGSTYNLHLLATLSTLPCPEGYTSVPVGIVTVESSPSAFPSVVLGWLKGGMISTLATDTRGAIIRHGDAEARRCSAA